MSFQYKNNCADADIILFQMYMRGVWYAIFQWVVKLVESKYWKLTAERANYRFDETVTRMMMIFLLCNVINECLVNANPFSNKNSVVNFVCILFYLRWIHVFSFYFISQYLNLLDIIYISRSWLNERIGFFSPLLTDSSYFWTLYIFCKIVYSWPFLL